MLTEPSEFIRSFAFSTLEIVRSVGGHAWRLAFPYSFFYVAQCQRFVLVRHEETTNLVNLFRCNLLPSLVRFLAIQLYHLFYSGLVSSHCAPDEIHAEVQLHCNTLLGQLRGSPQIYCPRLFVLLLFFPANITKITTHRRVLLLSICFMILDLSWICLQVAAEFVTFLQYCLWIFAS